MEVHPTPQSQSHLMERKRFLSFFLLLSPLLLLQFVNRAAAQATTDPSEVLALNTMLRRWGKQAASSWNISGEPCSGTALNVSSLQNGDLNPMITCDCTGTTCHITHLKVYALDVTGPVPEELQNLTRLIDLNLNQNYLTGRLPAFFGNFSAMQYLGFGINALSGPIPRELGRLSNLISLGMGTNNFSGPIPPDFGNLTSLKEWYLDSSGASGELPSELSELKNLQVLSASDNNFTGKIPDFIGGWTKLQVLRFQGNAFEGPIPASISKLTNLTDLRIGDIINGSSTLDFIGSMASLTTLTLRNSKISDSMPLDFSPFQSLQKLDLSFNNISGRLPDSLFNLSSLSYLFLGNNSISGVIPQQKSTSLSHIDLSYNRLSGNVPSWVGEKNLEINLVANNFVINGPSNNGIFLGLNCLQQDRPCFRGSPVYSSFAVNCGGSRTITASDNSVYDFDNTTLGSASDHVTDPIKWGVSNAGSFADSPNANYILTSQSQFQNTLDTELFQTQRLSPSSLRYYGIGFENGNYSIKLQFAELQLVDGPTWKSVGRRVFDIYIQGDLRLKDFDIRKEAGGVSLRPYVQQFTASVTNNFLEIHFFWAGKGTCCVPYQGYYGPSISAISVTPEFTPTVSNVAPTASSKKNQTGLAVGLSIGLIALALLLIFAIFRRQKKKSLRAEYEKAFAGMTVKPDIFSYSELKNATEDFNSSNMLGEGGYGPVFKGKLLDGRSVAVKQLAMSSHQGKHQFLTEIATISAVQHRNLVKLYGCCIEGNKPLLVYEYLENKSLDRAIFRKSDLHLDWAKRFEIYLGVARGLTYLHEESSVRIIHRDVKAANVLLDSELNAKLSDFGLAKFFDEKKTHVSTRVAGTFGYLAPEYAMRGLLTEKADVFAFGVLCLEVISGRPNSNQNLDEDDFYLLAWAWELHENKQDLDIVDRRLVPNFNKEEAARVIGVALLCTQALPAQRPAMSRVVAMLTGDVEVSEVTSRPSYLNDWKYKRMGGGTYTGYSDYPSEILDTTDTSRGENLRSTVSSAGSLMAVDIENGR